MNILEAKNYFHDLISAAKKYCADHTPLPFVLAASFIDYFSKMVKGKDKRGDGYKDFVRKYMKEVRQEYATFRYSNGVQDLHAQMYHILRCGIVHSFSLIPDKSYHKTPFYLKLCNLRLSGKTVYKHPGRDHSIALCHKAEADQERLKHLSPYSGPQNLDAALFVIEDFLDDLLVVNELIYKKALNDSKLREKIEDWLRVSPPISGGY
jgi:hypothetical protein